MFKDSSHAEFLSKRKLEQREYMRALSPAADILMRCVGASGSKELFQTVLFQFREKCNDSMLLRHILEHFDAAHYAHAYLGMVSEIESEIVSELVSE